MKQSGLIGIFFIMLLALPQITQAQVSVSDGTSASSYTDLSSAFNMINSGIYSGNISITITANISSVSSTASLNASGSGFANYSSVIIQPSSNYTISGSVNGPLIKLNGADNVTINGINASGKSLTISNTNTATGHTIQFTNGATGNTITNCTLQGSNQTDAYGVISFKGTAASNANNTISSNIITASSGGTPAYGIYADGDATGSSTTTYSSNVTVSSNYISDYASNTSHSFGIYLLNGHSNWSIGNNRFYQSASRSLSVSSYSYHGGVWIFSPQFGDFNVSSNTIGYASSSGTGTYTINTSSDIKFLGITLWVTGSTGNPSFINGNTINNISFTTASNGSSDATNSSCGVFSAIWARSGKIYLGNASGNTVGGSGNGIVISVTSSTGVSPQTLSNGITYGGSGGTVDNNTVGSIQMSYGGGTSGFPIAFNGINCTGSPTSISGNTVGHSSSANSIVIGPSSGTVTASYPVRGIYYSGGSGTTTVANNTVANIVQRSDGTDGYLGGIYFSNATASNSYTVYGNTIKSLSSYSSRSNLTTNPSCYGLNLSVSGSASLYSNTISSLRNQNSSVSTQVGVLGCMLSAGTGSTSTFYANRIYDLGTTSTTPASVGTYLYMNSGTWTLHNNMISAGNSYDKTLTGIECAGGTCSFYYNSVYLGGSNSFSGTNAAFKRTAGTHTLYNNIFFNDRVSSGNNYAMTNSATTGITANYNLYVANDTASIIVWSAANSWYNYYTSANTTDLFSWAEKRSNLNSALLFTSTSTGDLTIVTTNQTGWYVNGKGIAISGVDYDWELSGGDRASAVTDGATDIGADEFTSARAPIAATHVGSYTAGSTSTYYFAGKKVAEITWQNGSNLPSTQPSVLYYSGVNPPYFIPGATSFNAYWNISATDPGGMSYALKLWYSDAIMGSVSSGSNLRMAKNSNGLSTGWTCASSSTSVNTGARTFANTATYNSFSVFTGTDVTNPLPVEWLYFNANKTGNDVQLDWATASEQNSSYFEVQRSENGKDFKPLNRVEAIGFSNTPQYYVYTDAEAPHVQTIYYRLKQADRNGDFSYSPIRVVNDNTNNVVEVYPNPFANILHVQTNETCRAAYIYDTQGQLKYSNFTIDSERFSLSIPYLPAGVYTLKLVYDSGSKWVRITHP